MTTKIEGGLSGRTTKKELFWGSLADMQISSNTDFSGLQGYIL